MITAEEADRFLAKLGLERTAEADGIVYYGNPSRPTDPGLALDFRDGAISNEDFKEVLARSGLNIEDYFTPRGLGRNLGLTGATDA